MTKAEEMFDKLGYKKYIKVSPIVVNATIPKDNIEKARCDGYSICVRYEKLDNKDINITFMKDEDGISFDKTIDEENEYAGLFTTDELKAVIEQCKELGWED